MSSIAKPNKDKEIVLFCVIEVKDPMNVNYFNKVLCNDLKPFNITILKDAWEYENMMESYHK